MWYQYFPADEDINRDINIINNKYFIDVYYAIMSKQLYPKTQLKPAKLVFAELVLSDETNIMVLIENVYKHTLEFHCSLPPSCRYGGLYYKRAPLLRDIIHHFQGLCMATLQIVIHRDELIQLLSDAGYSHPKCPNGLFQKYAFAGYEMEQDDYFDLEFGSDKEY